MQSVTLGRFLSAACAICALAVPTTTARAVDRLVPDEFATIQAAINAASNGDVIVVSPGTYNESLLVHSKNITIRGIDGPEKTMVSARGLSTRVIRFLFCNTPGCRLEGLTLSDGYVTDSHGAGIDAIDSNLHLVDCVVTRNVVNKHGGSSGGGAWLVHEGTSTFENCRFSNNSANGHGGAIAANGHVNIVNCQFDSNRGSEGGAVSLGGGYLATITNCTFQRNTAYITGGGAMWLGHSSHATFTQCTLTDNHAEWVYGEGGAIDSSGHLVLDHCTFSGNTATSIGGAVCAKFSHSLHIRDCSFDANVASEGGGAVLVSNTPDALVTGTTFHNNSASKDGGAVHLVYSSNPVMRDVVYANNTAGQRGGALFLTKILTLLVERCAFEGNHAQQSGGALGWYLSFAPTIVASSFCGNSPTHFDEPPAGMQNLLSTSCPIGDVNLDGLVTIADLLAVIGAWGPCDVRATPCAADFTGDIHVGIADLLAVLSNWS